MSFFTTATGKVVSLAVLERREIDVRDIAIHLSHIRRFNGATKVGYCVAAHALHVSDIVRGLGGTLGAQLAGLHHDAHEYLLGDITTPVKDYLNSLSNNAFMTVEHHMQRRVLEGLGVRTAYVAHRKLIHQADMIALATERRDLQPMCTDHWPCLDGVEPDWRDVLDRAKLPDAVWAQAYVDRDIELREKMADLSQWPVKPEARG